MEVVVLGIANGDNEGNGVNDGCNNKISKLFLPSPLQGLLFPSVYIRAALGFLPKYLAWYLPRIPVGFTSEGDPRGSLE